MEEKKEDSPLRNGDHEYVQQNEQVVQEQSRKQQETSAPRRSFFFVRLLRVILIDTPLLLLFIGFVSSWCIHRIHDDLYVPFFRAATVTDERLMNEHTYYDRLCSHVDVTADNLSALVMNAEKDTSEKLVDTVLTHGGAVIPKVLKQDTVEKLRKFVVKRNDEIEELGEAYPVSQGYLRSSFGLDAAEDPIVAVALKEVASNALLKPGVAALVGPDPAVAEITVITNYEGCYEQAWHSDIKIDGNAVKFARTFTHSYSLFVPLQDTTAEMGATEMCPGTHYCANENLAEMCDKHGIQLSEASPDGVWHAGDGALLSQIVWHRGQAHTDPNALERILFVVTFISRPQPEIDHRQLSRGTYFHLKWNMWGHTWQDLMDAGTSMAKPWSYLRCLGLWKPKERNWGFDLLTASVLRIANNQNGFDSEDIPDFVSNVIEKKIHLPKMLHGRILFEHDDAWQVFLQETIDNTYMWFKWGNAAVLSIYVIMVVVVSCAGVGQDGHKKRIVPSALLRLAKTHALVFSLGYLFVRYVEQSHWGSNIQRGRTLPPSFPPRDPKTPLIFSGPTTYPERNDILVGSRFDGPYLGAFNDWLDYHPGNQKFLRHIQESASAHAMHSKNTVFADFLVKVIVDSVGGTRFLQQDHVSGHWMVMTEEQAQDYTRRALMRQASPWLASVDKALKFLLAEYRFGFHRGTRLARDSQAYLLQLRDLIYGFQKHPSLPQPPLGLVPLFQRVQLPSLPSVAGSVPKLSERRRVVRERTPYDLNVGDTIWGNWNGDDLWFQGVLAVDYGNGKYGISYEDDSFEEDVPKARIVKHVPLQSGDRVSVNYRGEGAWYIAEVLRVGPNRDIDVIFDDGEVLRDIDPLYYRDGISMFANVVVLDPEEDKYTDVLLDDPPID